MHLECFGLDCMKRQKRQKLVRDLWRLASIGLGSGPGRPATAGSSPTLSNKPLDMKIKSTLNSVLKRLDVDELELLLESVKSKGRAHNQCIHVALHPQPITSSHTCVKLSDESAICNSAPPSVYAPSCELGYTAKHTGMDEASWATCRAWRWATLPQTAPLKPIPYCQIPAEQRSVETTDGLPTDCSRQSRTCCINPYHWCRINDSNISDITRSPSNAVQDETTSMTKEITISSQLSTESGLSSGFLPPRSDYWCQVAYWELSTRIGQLLPITPSCIDIFQDITQGCGVSLDALHKTHTAKSQAIASVRSKIGAGVTLSKEGDLVWLYNRSERDVFVSSYTLNSDNNDNDVWRVCKVAPGYSTTIYNYNIVHRQLLNSKPLTSEHGPTDLHSIHVSFLKGWSGSYSRQTVLSCECWLEILINETIFIDR